MRAVLVIGCAVVGATVGVLASYAIFRFAVPWGTAPRGECPHCGAALPTGWRGSLRAGSRCSTCRTVLAKHRWAYVAAATAGFAGLAWRLPLRRPADIALLAAWLVLAAVGVVLAGIDLSVRRLPLPILGGCAAVVGSLVVLAAACAHDLGLLVRAVVVAAAFGSVYLILAIAGPGPVGMGDVYLATLLGLILGTGSTGAILAGALAPYLAAGPVTAILLAVGRIGRRCLVPMGPYLIAGALVAKLVMPV